MMESNKQKRDLRHKREERWNNIRKARKYEKEKLQEELDLRLPPLKKRELTLGMDKFQTSAFSKKP